MEWLIIGFVLLGVGSLLYFSKTAAEWVRKSSRPETKPDAESNVSFGRYFYTPRIIFAGLIILGFMVPILFGVEPTSVWIGLPYLILGAIFGILAVLFLFSKRFANFYWTHVWHYDRKKERNHVAFVFLLLTFGMFFGAYLFSGVFLYWP